jgi:hypothetical protein
MAGAIAGDDPVRAASALLVGRTGCLAAASVACLAAFEQSGSALMEADSYAIEHGTTTGSPSLLPHGGGTLLERTGNLAIVTLHETTAGGKGDGAKGDGAKGDGAKGGDSEPASLLLVKGEVGWRLRQVFD